MFTTVYRIFRHRTHHTGHGLLWPSHAGHEETFTATSFDGALAMAHEASPFIEGETVGVLNCGAHGDTIQGLCLYHVSEKPNVPPPMEFTRIQVSP